LVPVLLSVSGLVFGFRFWLAEKEMNCVGAEVNPPVCVFAFAQAGVRVWVGCVATQTLHHQTIPQHIPSTITAPNKRFYPTYKPPQNSSSIINNAYFSSLLNTTTLF
jgi:hypothetical protein